MFQSPSPLDDDAFIQKQSELQGYVEITGRNFTHQSDLEAGAWRNFFIGIVGDLSSEEHEVLWPNRVGLSLMTYKSTPICKSLRSPVS